MNIGNFLGSAASIFGGPWGALGGGLLSGLFGGGGPQLPPELKRLYKIQAGAAQDLQHFSRSVPMSDPLEQAALASQRGLLGQQQMDQRNQLFASLSPDAMTNTPDFLTNLTNQQYGQQANLTSQNFLNSLLARRQALMGAANVAQGAAGSVNYQQPFDLSPLLQQLSHAYAYRKASRGPVGTGGGTVGDLTPTSYGSWMRETR